MTPVPELRLDSLVPVPDHVVVGHVDEPVQRDAREAASAEELLLEPVLVPHPQRTPAGGLRQQNLRGGGAVLEVATQVAARSLDDLVDVDQPETVPLV